MEVENQDFDKQIEELLAKEKTARMKNEHLESIKILKGIVRMGY